MTHSAAIGGMRERCEAALREGTAYAPLPWALQHCTDDWYIGPWSGKREDPYDGGLEIVDHVVLEGDRKMRGLGGMHVGHAPGQLAVEAVNALPVLLARLDAHAALLKECAGMMKKHEHGATFIPGDPDSTGGPYEVCPECDEALGGGHAPDCAYAALMKRVDAEVGP